MILEKLTPEQKFFSGDVYGVQLPGIGGLFEVLEKHAPLVSALKEGKLKSCSGKKVTSKKQAVAIGLSEARKEGNPPSRYMTSRNKKLKTEKQELMKYNPFLRRHTLHKEIK